MFAAARARELRSPHVPRSRLGTWWLNAPVRRKMLSVVLLIALACVPAIAVGLALDTRLADARDDIGALSRAAADLDAVHDSLIVATSSMQDYIILGFRDPRYVERYRAAAESIPAELATLADGLPADLAQAERELAASVGTLLTALDTLSTRTASLDPSQGIGFDLDVPGAEQVLAEIVSSLVATSDAYEQVEILDNQINAEIDARREDVDELQSRLVWATTAGIAAALIAAALGLSVVTSGIVRRIERVSDNGIRFLEGEPPLPAAPSTDEIGRLAEKVFSAGALLESRRAEAEAATRAKDEVLSRVSHELTTPLTTMIGLGRLLADDPDLGPEDREDAQHIVRAGHQLHGLIQEMLDIKAIEAGKLSLVIEPVPVHDAADDAIHLVQPAAGKRSIAFHVDCPDDLVVAADRRRLREILLNLLSNAVKYNHEGGRIDLTARRRDGIVHVRVTDTGPGISPDDQRHLFEPFERLEAATSDIEGSGVGLSLTRHVVEAMDGAIGVESTVGEGSTFWFDLPASDAGPGAGVGPASGRRPATT
ncbi:MAG TPA: ATP-binding protein [Acidimicrobiales bacterium]|nr:ATP-binding protein [Acidimicrobiales bacterium]